MSIFGRILDSITGKAKAATPATAAPAAAASAAATPVATPAAPQTQAVDVETTLDQMARDSGHPSNWRTSIVDLMKLVGMESSLAERKELAQELGYTGDMNDSATMNVWLHKHVMAKLSEAKA